ncbi:patatin-like phospholipase family protein [Sphingomonas bacterium]|uniref:patatin-like phospholipase family protein n=1 Tax=Sphingomonas bacterium TaxID=1895847 RepID=UPI001576973C|nr:patatin-like phospholipase family protein [Sphingomonas bacterium]
MADPAPPVRDGDGDGNGDGARAPDDAIGIALSGGGYRAMLFHAGAIVRLYETGLLGRAARISSVSGGSITSAKLALEWPRVTSRDALFGHVVEPIRRMAGTGIDVSAVLGGVFLPGSVGDRVAAAYARHLFGDATLQDLPVAPVFVINATNVETGSLWRFSRARARDWQVGEIAAPRLRLADAVTASSAFPPVLSPFVLKVGPADFTTVEAGVDASFLRDIALTDGGVYDNLGLETVFKRCRTLFVSNGGAALARDGSPASDWLGHTRRIIDIIDNQVGDVRTRQLIETLKLDDANPLHRRGAYWGIGGDAGSLGLPDSLPAPLARTRELAATPTRLSAMPAALQERLMNWGYVACDAAVRRWYPAGGPYRAPALPYPANPI